MAPQRPGLPSAVAIVCEYANLVDLPTILAVRISPRLLEKLSTFLSWPSAGLPPCLYLQFPFFSALNVQ